MRFYRRRAKAPRAPQGGTVLRLPKQPKAFRWDQLSGDFIEQENGPYLGVPQPVPHGGDGGNLGGDFFGADGDFSDLASDGDEPANEYILHLDAHGSTDRWLQHQFSRTCAVRQLQLAEVEDGCEVVLVTPVYNAETRRLGVDARTDAEQQAARANPFALLHVRQVLCSDGVIFCNTCANPGCNRTPAENHRIDAAMQHHNQRHTTQGEVFGATEPLCRCAKAAINALWPEDDERPEPFPHWFEQQEPGAVRTPS